MTDTITPTPDTATVRGAGQLDLHTAYETLARAFLRHYMADLREQAARSADDTSTQETPEHEQTVHPPTGA